MAATAVGYEITTIIGWLPQLLLLLPLIASSSTSRTTAFLLANHTAIVAATAIVFIAIAFIATATATATAAAMIVIATTPHYHSYHFPTTHHHIPQYCYSRTLHKK